MSRWNARIAITAVVLIASALPLAVAACGGGSKQNPQSANSATQAAQDAQLEQEFTDRARTDAEEWYATDSAIVAALQEFTTTISGDAKTLKKKPIRKLQESLDEWKDATSPSERFQSSFDLWMVVVADQEKFLAVLDRLPKTMHPSDTYHIMPKVLRLQEIVNKMSVDFDAYTASLP